MRYRFHSPFKLVFALVLALFLRELAQACPCGCSAPSSLYLFPGEQWKVQSSVGHSQQGQILRADGSPGLDDGPQQTDTFELALARALTQDLALTLTLPASRNWHPEAGADTAWADPSLGLRWVPLRGSFARPWQPEVQTYVSYKQALSIEPAPQEHGITQHSNGWSEILPGVDLWFVLDPIWSVGLSGSLVIRPEAHDENAGLDTYARRSGLASRLGLQGSYTLPGTGQLIASFERESKAGDTRDGILVPQSDQLRHVVGLAGSLRVGDGKSVGLSYKRSAYVFFNYGVPRVQTTTLSYTQAFL